MTESDGARCALCDAILSASAFGGDTIDGWRIDRCDECGAGTAVPVSLSKDDFSYDDYGDYLLLEDEAAIKARVESERAGHGEKFRALVRRFGEGARAIDFGCGAGYHAQAANAEGLRCSGVEISDKIRSFAVERVGFTDVFETLDEAPKDVNAIFMNDVIEHLERDLLRETLAAMYDRLAPGGVLIGNTPNFRSLNLRLKKTKDPAVAPPSHIVYFTPRALDQFLATFGFVAESIKTRGFSSNAFFRPEKFGRSFLEKPVSASPLWKRPLWLGLKVGFKLGGYVVGAFGAGYQIDFVFRKPAK
jgi:SAM-dependent methyltransferase